MSVSLASVPPASLSIVLPAYNEEANIRAAVEAAQTAADELERPY
jgi:glycosyltransferase involved in cell wall biosynthesis